MKVTIEGHVVAKQEPWETEPTFTFFDFHSDSWVKVCPASVTVEIPDDWDIRPGKIESLKSEMEKIKAAFHARVGEINSEIQSLLAIEA